MEEKYVIVKPKVSELSLLTLEIMPEKGGFIMNIYDIPVNVTIQVRPYVDTYDTFEFQDHYSTPCVGQTPPMVLPNTALNEVVENGVFYRLYMYVFLAQTNQRGYLRRRSSCCLTRGFLIGFIFQAVALILCFGSVL